MNVALVLDQSARPSRRAVALVVAALLTTFDLSINHFWSGFRYNDNIRYYFFEDLSIIGGLLLLATAGGGDISLDTWRSKELPLQMVGSRSKSAAAERQSLLSQYGAAEEYSDTEDY